MMVKNIYLLPFGNNYAFWKSEECNNWQKFCTVNTSALTYNQTMGVNDIDHGISSSPSFRLPTLLKDSQTERNNIKVCGFYTN